VSGTVVLKAPDSCGEAELASFEALVRQSGEVVERGLTVRIRAAACLGFCYAAQGELAGIAALKVPFQTYRDRVFRKARSGRPPVAYGLELGWFFVRPGHRGRRLARELATGLLDREPYRAIFSTTRSDNTAMLKVLGAVGFEPTGQPYPRDTGPTHEKLVLLVRPARRKRVRESA
jgi:hypothetical protein